MTNFEADKLLKKLNYLLMIFLIGISDEIEEDFGKVKMTMINLLLIKLYMMF